METLTPLFHLKDKDVVSIIGSGGKTSLIRCLSQHKKDLKVLVSTTTKMGQPKKSDYDYFYTDDFERLKESKTGITMVGTVTQTKERTKLSFPKDTCLTPYFSYYNLTLLEADGSKCLPLKAWEDFEPVVLDETTVTIGIMPLTVLGKPINEKTVHRLPLFLHDFSLKKGQLITPQLFVDIILSSKGLFQKAKGRKILYFSQYEINQHEKQLKQILTLLGEKRQIIPQIIAGNTIKNEGVSI